MYWMHTPHYSIDITWCTLLIPSNLHHAHSSLFCRKWLSIYMIHTLLRMNKDFDCTLLVNLLDAHSSLFHRLYMMHTPHYSPGSGWVYTSVTHSCQWTETSTLSMHSNWIHTPHYSMDFTWCTLLIIPSNLHHAHSSFFCRKWLSIYMIYTLLQMNKDLTALSW